MVWAFIISSFEELLDKGNSVPIHQNNQKSAVEMFKTYMRIALEIVNEVL